MNDDIYLKKKALRKKIRKLKKEITVEERDKYSTFVMGKIQKSNQFKSANTIFNYWAMDDEVDTRSFIRKWYKEKDFILPTIDGNDLILKRFTGDKFLKNGDLYSIPEPKGGAFNNIADIDLAIIPGIAFDKHNNRMGRGKAYYDKVLKQMKNRTFLIGICYDFQLVDNVPIETHDITMNEVICS